jgi:hypothetical protein
MKLRVLKSFDRYHAGDVCNLPDEESRVLIALKLAEVFKEEETVEAPKPKRRYRRRDATPKVAEVMVAEPLQEEVKEEATEETEETVEEKPVSRRRRNVESETDSE